jgi:hypothetical protein
MLQADSSLRYADVDSILRRASADLGAEGYDHVFGYGRIDALKAVRLTLGRRVRAVPDSVLVTTPTGGSATCSVSLAVAPTADVTLSLVSSDPSQGEPFPVSIVFSSMNWNTPQEIVITGRGDPDATLDVPYSVIMTSSSQDRLYDNILPAEIRLINRPAGVSGVREEGAAPGQFALAQNYPNPFNPTTTIRYRLTTRSRVTLKVYDVLDREVATLVSRVEEPGYKAVQFDAGGLASGVYFYRMQAGSLVDVKKLVVLR